MDNLKNWILADGVLCKDQSDAGWGLYGKPHSLNYAPSPDSVLYPIFSKDMIIEAVRLAHLPGAANIVYPIVIAGVFITAFYSFRLIFMVFHGEEKNHSSTGHHFNKIKESPLVITLPLIALAVPSIIVGYLLIQPMLFGTNDTPAILSDAILVDSRHNAMADLAILFHSPFKLMQHALMTPAFWMMTAGILLAWLLVLKKPQISQWLHKNLAWLRFILENGYGFDRFNEVVIAKTSRNLGLFFSQVTDAKIIDQYLVNGSAYLIASLSSVVRKIQTGYVYHYAFLMILALVVMLGYFLFSH